MKNLNYSQWLVYWLLFILVINSDSLYGQCGASPAPSTVTITAANTIVNSYYPGTSSVTSGNSLSVGTIDGRGSSNAIAVGDLLVIMQMQGADINANNTVAYGGGNGAAPANGYSSTNLVAGYYEYATVSSVSGSPISSITLTVALSNVYHTRSFTSSNAIQTYQVIRVPRYYNLTINAAPASITAPAWNGQVGRRSA